MPKILSALIAFTLLTFVQPVFAQPAAPDLSSVVIVPPSPGTDPALAAFSGKWQGQWKNGPMTNLAVTRVDGPQKVIAVYALGDYAAWGLKQPVKLDRLATFDGRQLTFTIDMGTVAYTLDGANKLSAVFLNKSGGGRQTGTLVRSQ